MDCVATGLVVLALRRRKAWLRGLLQLVGIGLSGTCTWIVVDLAWPTQRLLMDGIAGLHATAAAVVLTRAFRSRKSD